MNIRNNTYIYHKIVEREWGLECRITVLNADNIEMSYNIPLPDSPIVLEQYLSDKIEEITNRRLLTSSRS